MMVRTQIQLTQAQATAIRKLAQRRGLSIAEVIRHSIEQYLALAEPPARLDAKERALAACKQFQSGRPDISEQHDEHLAQVYAGEPLH